MSRCHPSTAPSDGLARRAPVTLALVTVAAIHLFAWRWVMEHPRSHTFEPSGATVPDRPLIVALLPQARPLTPQPPEPRSLRLFDRHTARTAPAEPRSAPPPRARAAAKKGNPPAASASIHSRADGPSAAPESVAPATRTDWQRDLSSVGKPRRFQYTSPAARAAVAAGASIQQQANAASESPLEKEAARAAKIDCRANYAEMGLLALPMLARDALSRSGCRW